MQDEAKQEFLLRVQDLRLDNVIIFLVKDPKSYLSESDLVSIRSLNLNVMYEVMMVDVVRLRDVDFWDLKQPRLDYEQQQQISNERIDKATACALPAQYTTVSTQAWSSDS